MTYKDMVLEVLKSTKIPYSCARIKHTVNFKFKVKIKNGTVSCILYRLFKDKAVTLYGNVGVRGGIGYLLIREK